MRTLHLELQERYHPTPIVERVDDEGMTLLVNKNWIAPIAHCHAVLVTIFRLFYELSATCSQERMSPTEVEELTSKLLVRDQDPLVTIDNNVLSKASRRHSVADLASKLTIREKADWSRSRTAKVRNLSLDLKVVTTAKQLDAIANRFVWSLRQNTPDEQKAGIRSLPRQIYIDTRSSAGFPKGLEGLPVGPVTDSAARLQYYGDSWHLWIERSGVRDDLLNHLGAHNFSRCPTPPPKDQAPVPWWVGETLRQELAPFVG